MLKLSTLTLSIIMLIGSCNTKKSEEKKTNNWDVENTKMVESYDEINKLAIKDAQDSLAFFLELFDHRQKNGFEFYIKSRFSDVKNIEHMWSIVKSVKSDTLFATLDNVPLKLTNIKRKDEVKVTKENVEDWSVYKGDYVLYGDFIKKHTK